MFSYFKFAHWKGETMPCCASFYLLQHALAFELAWILYCSSSSSVAPTSWLKHFFQVILQSMVCSEKRKTKSTLSSKLLYTWKGTITRWHIVANSESLLYDLYGAKFPFWHLLWKASQMRQRKCFSISQTSETVFQTLCENLLCSLGSIHYTLTRNWLSWFL